MAINSRSRLCNMLDFVCNCAAGNMVEISPSISIGGDHGIFFRDSIGISYPSGDLMGKWWFNGI